MVRVLPDTETCSLVAASKLQTAGPVSLSVCMTIIPEPFWIASLKLITTSLPTATSVEASAGVIAITVGAVVSGITVTI